MKLEDIQSAVKHAAEAEFKRAFYNICAVEDYDDIIKLIDGLIKEVYEGTSSAED